MSYLCLFVHSSVQHIVFLFWFYSSCVTYVASFSGLSIFEFFGVLQHLFHHFQPLHRVKCFMYIHFVLFLLPPHKCCQVHFVLLLIFRCFFSEKILHGNYIFY
jgi:hypothetical protein